VEPSDAKALAITYLANSQALRADPVARASDLYNDSPDLLPAKKPAAEMLNPLFPFMPMDQ
jgi:hypothetical protein